jgi:hypothetical protein
MNQITINAVAFQEDGMWVAQCLEFNFVSFAPTKEELTETLLCQILDQVELDQEDGHEPFHGFRPAPPEYWSMFEQARKNSQPMETKKTVGQRVKGLIDGTLVNTQVFPVAAMAAS